MSIPPEDIRRQKVGLLRLALFAGVILFLLIIFGIKVGDSKPNTGSGDVTPYACDPYIPGDC